MPCARHLFKADGVNSGMLVFAVSMRAQANQLPRAFAYPISGFPAAGVLRLWAFLQGLKGSQRMAGDPPSLQPQAVLREAGTSIRSHLQSC